MDDDGLIRVYMGHVNSRNFVALSVWRTGGLVGFGSENNNLFVYDRGVKIGPIRWASPIRPKLGSGWAIKLLARKKSG